MKLTPDQLKIITLATEAGARVGSPDTSLEGGRLINVPGVAGAGKSAIIVELARRDATRRILFLAQSRSVADRARATLPPNVYALTVQDAAYRFLQRLYSTKLEGNSVQNSLTDAQMQAATGVGATRQELSRARQILYRFYRSASRCPEPAHLPASSRSGDEWVHHEGEARRAIQIARDCWFSQCNRSRDSAPLTYSAVIKLWTQAVPENVQLPGGQRSIRLDPLHGASLVILEEAQDADEAQLGFLARQNIEVIMFGDGFQSLRQGNRRIQAQNHPLQLRAETVHLRDSFRYGPSIASLLNTLSHRAGSPRPDRVLGRGSSNVYPSAHRYTWEAEELPYTLIANSVVTLFEEALQATRRGRQIAWVDGLESYPAGLLRDLILLAGSSDPLRHAALAAETRSSPSLAGVRDLDEARLRFKQRWDATGLELLEWVESCRDREPDLFEVVAGWCDADRSRQQAMLDRSQPPPGRDITLTTVVRAKGHEWSRVVVAEDCFPSRLIGGAWQLAKRDRVLANRAYTAISRAQTAVTVPESYLAYLRANGVTLAENSHLTGEEPWVEETVHPYFGIQRMALLEMSPLLRRRRMALKPPKRPSTMPSGQLRLKAQIESDAEALRGCSVDELRSMLRGSRGRRDRGGPVGDHDG